VSNLTFVSQYVLLNGFFIQILMGTCFKKKAEFRIGRSTAFKIVFEVCQIIWNVLQSLYLPQLTHEVWRHIANEFMQQWQFPNCIGILEGKYIRIQSPKL